MVSDNNTVGENVKSRIGQILETQHETEKDTIDALRALSSFCTVNSSLANRNLKNQIEKRNLETYESFVRSFHKVKINLDSLYEDVFKMNSAIDNMATRLQDSKEKTHHLIAQTNVLQEEKRRVEKQSVLANSLISHFQLTPPENATLHGIARDSPISSDFFTILERVNRLHNDCKTLMHSGFETAALDIMEKISLHREAAVERLYRWTQHGCRTFDASDRRSLIPRAVRELQARPVLFKYVLDEYCTARKASLLRAFIDALTEGSGAGKPIEHYAHDPQRYVGDILAWVHQALPVERESLTVLLKSCEKINLSDEIYSSLVDITEGLCHPLKIRIELILTADRDAIPLGTVVDLIRYYGKVMQDQVRGGLLLMTLNELLIQSESAFLAAVGRRVVIELSRGVRAPPSDLTPSSVVTDLLSFLREILSTKSAVDQAENLDSVKAVADVLDPLLGAVNETACHLSTADMAVYLLNCMYQMQCTVSLCGAARDYGERLQAQAEAQMDTLTAEQAGSLVANLGLGPVYTLLQGREGRPLSAVPGMEAGTLKAFMNKLDGFIVMPDVFLLPQMNLLMSSSYKSTVRKRSLEVIVAIYKDLFAAVYDEKNKYLNPETVIRRTPEEVIQLLSL